MNRFEEGATPAARVGHLTQTAVGEGRQLRPIALQSVASEIATASEANSGRQHQHHEPVRDRGAYSRRQLEGLDRLNAEAMSRTPHRRVIGDGSVRYMENRSDFGAHHPLNRRVGGPILAPAVLVPMPPRGIGCTPRQRGGCRPEAGGQAAEASSDPIRRSPALGGWWRRWSGIGEIFPRVGFIVTNMTAGPEGVVRFYNGRGTAEQWIKEGKYALNWTRLSCHRFVANRVRLSLFPWRTTLGTLRRLCLPNRV